MGQLAGVIDVHNAEGTLKQLESPGMWIAVAFQMITAALLILMYSESDEHLSRVLCVNIGISADVILRGISKASPPLLPGSTDKQSDRH